MKTYPEITTIPPEDYNQYPTKSFEGTIIVVEKLQDVDKAVSFLSTQPILGFDIFSFFLQS